jgi:hypothetical protein
MVADVIKWQYARMVKMFGDLLVEPATTGAGLDANKLSRYKTTVRGFVHKVAFSLPAEMRPAFKITPDASDDGEQAQEGQAGPPHKFPKYVSRLFQSYLSFTVLLMSLSEKC